MSKYFDKDKLIQVIDDHIDATLVDQEYDSSTITVGTVSDDNTWGGPNDWQVQVTITRMDEELVEVVDKYDCTLKSEVVSAGLEKLHEVIGEGVASYRQHGDVFYAAVEDKDGALLGEFRAPLTSIEEAITVANKTIENPSKYVTAVVAHDGY